MTTPSEAPADAGYLLDVNLLVALTLRDHVQHRPAQAWFSGLQANIWATCSFTEAGFVRVCMNPNVTDTPISWSAGLEMLSRFRSVAGHRLVADDVDLLASEVVKRAPVSGHRQVSDTYLAALAAKHSLLLATLDRGVAEALHPEDREVVHLIGQRGA